MFLWLIPGKSGQIIRRFILRNLRFGPKIFGQALIYILRSLFNKRAVIQQVLHNGLALERPERISCIVMLFPAMCLITAENQARNAIMPQNESQETLLPSCLLTSYFILRAPHRHMRYYHGFLNRSFPASLLIVFFTYCLRDEFGFSSRPIGS